MTVWKQDCTNVKLNGLKLSGGEKKLTQLENVIFKMCLEIIYSIYMYKKGFGIKRPTMVDMP